MTRVVSRIPLGTYLENFPHNSNYSIKVETAPPRNQGRYNDCWAFGTTGYFANCNPELAALPLEERYLALQAVRSSAMSALAQVGGQINPGGSLEGAEVVMREHGVIPVGVWEPAIDIASAPHADRIIYYINNRLARLQEESDKLRKNSVIKKKLLAQATQDIEKIIKSYSGKMPKTFSIDGKTYTPQAYYQEKVAPYVTVMDDITINRSLPSGKAITTPGADPDLVVRKQLGMNATIKEIIAALNRGETVPLGFECNINYINNKNGVMSLKAFKAPRGFKPPSQDYRRNAKLFSGGHMVDIVGVDLDDKGNFVKFLIKNSWGQKIGDDGFFHMYADYFRAFALRVYIKSPALKASAQ